MMHLEPHILFSMLQDKEHEIASLKAQLATERQIALRWEHEAKAYRKKCQALQMDKDDTHIIQVPQ